MKLNILVILLCICSIQLFYAQSEDSMIYLTLPVRNSLTFNRYTINPTFSFVREQNKFISLYNKREWVQFDDAPLTYLASYTGRFAENIGASVGLYQQNYGVLTTFGGVLNFAYNVRIARESNLTFGLNVGAYNSTINSGNIVTNFDDPSLNNIPESFMLTINPGINYGLAFFDFGLSVNNLVVYDFESSQLIEDSPDYGIQAHIMYTGYMNSRGFFDESKFSGLIRTEFRNDDTIVSGIAMLTIPKGIWAQAGYNSLYGVSGGLGINLTPQIAMEYNYEVGVGELTEFGPSHDITLAYRFKTKERYDYSSGDEVAGLLSTDKKRSIPKANKKKAEENRRIANQNKAIIQANQEAAQKAKGVSTIDSQAKILAAQKAKEKAEEEAQIQAKLLAEQKAKEEAEAQARLLEEQKAKGEAEEQAKLLADQKAKEEAEAQARLLEEQKAKEEAQEQAKLLADQKAKEEAEAQARLLAEQKVKEEAEAQAQLEAERKEIEKEEQIEELITNPKDETGRAMYAISQKVEDSKTKQDQLLKAFDDIVQTKDKDLKDLKEENDLSEQGIAVAPKPFKSVTAENQKLQAIIDDLDKIIDSREKEIEELKQLYEDKYEDEIGTVYLNEVYLYYKKTLEKLELEQYEAKQTKLKLEAKLEDIQIATEYERNRRIKRAAFNNEDDRYANDRAALKNIKTNTAIGEQVFTTEDFDFGEEQTGNIQILKNIDRVDEGYYLIIAVHSDTDRRNDFVTKVYASGQTNVDYFYDVNTSKYYIYYDKFNSIGQANEALKAKGSKPFNTKMTVVKIEK